MALLASGHTTLETVSQIGITNFVEGCDDLLLNGICHFHFVLRCHAPIYVARSDEPRFWGNGAVRVEAPALFMFGSTIRVIALLL
jgi:hypothetical protein